MKLLFRKKTVAAMLAGGLLLAGCTSTSTAAPATTTAAASSAGAAATGTPATSGTVKSGAGTAKSGSGTAKASPGKSGTTTAAPGLPKGVTAASSIPTSAPNNVKLRANVAMTSCKSVGGGWAATGTASNPGKKDIDYTITVFFTTTTATVINSTQTHLTVKPGEKKTWTATKKFTTPAKMLCVLRGIG